MLNSESESARKHALQPELRANSPGFLTQVNHLGLTLNLVDFQREGAIMKCTV